MSLWARERRRRRSWRAYRSGCEQKLSRSASWSKMKPLGVVNEVVCSREMMGLDPRCFGTSASRAGESGGHARRIVSKGEGPFKR